MASAHFRIFSISLALAATLHAETTTVPEAPQPSPPPTRTHSFLDPIEDFARDSIIHPSAPFELVPGKNPNGWEFVIEPYVWAMGIQGKTGVGGMPAMDVQSTAIEGLKYLDWGIMAMGEIRKGRWGVLGDGYYAALSGSGDLEGILYKSGSIQMQQALASLSLAYRIIDDRRGFLDIYAGARYNFLGIQMEFDTDPSGINALGVQISDAVASRISSAVQAQVDIVKPEIVSAVTAELQARLQSVKAEVTAAADAAVSAAQARVAATKSLASATVSATVETDQSGKLLSRESKTKPSIESLKALHRLAGDSRDRTHLRRHEQVQRLEERARASGQRVDQLRRAEGERDALRSIDRKDLREILASSKGAIREYIRAQVELEVAKVTGAVTSAIQNRADAAKAKLAKSIANSVEEAIPTSASGDEWWIDPIVGLRGQINITRWLFLAAQGDVGGFGVGSQITWNTQATIGVNFTRNIFAELGYRYMYVDYDKNNFLYQMNSYGLFSSIGVKF